jgi:glycosyltransferase involved in cell wall biosynthesis
VRVLFIHQNFPGQYKHLAPALAARPGTEVRAIGERNAPGLKGINIVRYQPARSTSKHIHPWATDFETKLIRGEAALRAASDLRAGGFTPDIVCAHPGWGEALFLKDVWPDTKLLYYFEFFYNSTGSDVAFDPEFAEDDRFMASRVRAKNANHLFSLLDCDRGVSPTVWQWKQFPEPFRAKISVIHDGVDTDVVRPAADASLKLSRDNVTLRAGDEVVTFVNRNLEPVRGYHIFMRALPEILRRRPRARAIVIGGAEVSYGKGPPEGKTFRDMFMDEVKDRLDFSRVHFVGRVPYSVFLKVLQVSSAHVYLTYPFVLSWSMLEAMASECLVIGSRTPPVSEVIEHGVDGLLVDFFSPAELAEAVVGALAEPKRYSALRKNARRKIVERYDLKRVCLPKHLALVDAVAAGRFAGAGELAQALW